MEGIRAVYRNGVLVPKKKLPLEEGEEVVLLLKRPGNVDKYFGIFNGKRVEKIIEEIENEGVL